MEPITLALIGTAVFGVITTISVFVRQLLLSRDKRLNDKAHKKALSNESKHLEKLRSEMQATSRFSSHYKMLGDNKAAIAYIEQKIEDVLQKKLALIERFAKLVKKESEMVIDGESDSTRVSLSSKLQSEIDRELDFYDKELAQLQERRANLWDTRKDLQQNLLNQEHDRSTQLDDIYQKHTTILEKVYLKHNDNANDLAKKTIDAGTSSIKTLMSPWEFFLKIFGLASGIDKDKLNKEINDRNEVSNVEDDINNDDLYYNEDYGYDNNNDQYEDDYDKMPVPEY